MATVILNHQAKNQSHKKSGRQKNSETKDDDGQENNQERRILRHQLLSHLWEYPSQDEFRYSGNLEKLACWTVSWRAVECCATSAIFAVGKCDQSQTGKVDLIDWIPLEDIEFVKEDTSHEKSKKRAIGKPMRKSVVEMRHKSEMKHETEVPPGWEMKVQPSTGKTFYVNNTTKETQWEPPVVDAANVMTSSHSMLPAAEDHNPGFFEIKTTVDGHNFGRLYHFRTTNKEDATKWVTALENLVKQRHRALEDELQLSCQQKVIFKCQVFRENPAVQLGFGSAIILSTLLDIVAIELKPEKDSTASEGLAVAEWILTSVFASELVLNFLADFFWDFWKSPWNLFDAIVVLTTIATSVMDSNLNLGVLRLVRILRVVRLINFAGSLKNIITAMFSATLPVLNSFALLGLGHLVFALVGVDFFGKDNPELFGSFFVGLFTLLQCTTADNWTDIVFHISAAQNGVEFDPDNELLEPYVVLFFVLFMIVNHIVLINIVIAVLLDGFLNTMSEERQTAVEMLEMQRDEHDSFFELMEPLTQFRSANDLTLTMEEIYEKLDLDNSGQVSFMEFHDGLRKLFKMHISLEDWEIFVEGHIPSVSHAGDAWSTSSWDVELSKEQFVHIMSKQLTLYIQRRLSKALIKEDLTPAAVLPALKWMLIEIMKLQTPLSAGQSAGQSPDLSPMNKPYSPLSEIGWLRGNEDMNDTVEYEDENGQIKLVPRHVAMQMGGQYVGSDVSQEGGSKAAQALKPLNLIDPETNKRHVLSGEQSTHFQPAKVEPSTEVANSVKAGERSPILAPNTPAPTSWSVGAGVVGASIGDTAQPMPQEALRIGMRQNEEGQFLFGRVGVLEDRVRDLSVLIETLRTESSHQATVLAKQMEMTNTKLDLLLLTSHCRSEGKFGKSPDVSYEALVSLREESDGGGGGGVDYPAHNKPNSDTLTAPKGTKGTNSKPDEALYAVAIPPTTLMSPTGGSGGGGNALTGGGSRAGRAKTADTQGLHKMQNRDETKSLTPTGDETKSLTPTQQDIQHTESDTLKNDINPPRVSLSKRSDVSVRPRQNGEFSDPELVKSAEELLQEMSSILSREHDDKIVRVFNDL